MDAVTNLLNERPAWNDLVAHYQKLRDLPLRKLFADDPTRGERMTAETVGLSLDYSKNRRAEMIGGAHRHLNLQPRRRS